MVNVIDDEHAATIADALRDLDGVAVVPDPPHTSHLHLHLRTTATAFAATVLDVAETDRVWTWQRAAPTDNPAWLRVELAVGDATLDFTADEVRALLARFVS